MKEFKIGVTGHRKLTDYNQCRLAVQHFVSYIYSQRSDAFRNMEMILLSPLAEGADRIAAREWLKYSCHHLECPLPLPIKDYLKDFDTEESREDFFDLLSYSRNTAIMPVQKSRSAAYKTVGYYVVDNCDLLLAIWNGLAPTNDAGAAAIVNYARSLTKPIYWIHSENSGKVETEFNDKIFGNVKCC